MVSRSFGQALVVLPLWSWPLCVATSTRGTVASIGETSSASLRKAQRIPQTASLQVCKPRASPAWETRASVLLLSCHERCALHSASFSIFLSLLGLELGQCDVPGLGALKLEGRAPETACGKSRAFPQARDSSYRKAGTKQGSETDCLIRTGTCSPE